MDAGLAAIIGAAVGAIGGAGGQLIARGLDYRRESRDRKLAALEAALSALLRERLALIGWWNALKAGEADAAKEDAEKVNRVIEEVWHHENALRIRFGSESWIYDAHH